VNRFLEIVLRVLDFQFLLNDWRASENSQCRLILAPDGPGLATFASLFYPEKPGWLLGNGRMQERRRAILIRSLTCNWGK
jgi:hypothetical protein